MTKQKKGEMANQYSLSSHLVGAVNMEAWENHLLCPKGHQNKSILERMGLLVHLKCNICGKMWWIEEWKYPKDTTKKW